MNTTTSRVLIAASLLALVFHSGCNTTAEKSAKQGPKEEYVTLEPEIGSRVKKRVKKSELQNQTGMSPNRKVKVEVEMDTNSAPITTSGEMERSVTGR